MSQFEGVPSPRAAAFAEVSVRPQRESRGGIVTVLELVDGALGIETPLYIMLWC